MSASVKTVERASRLATYAHTRASLTRDDRAVALPTIGGEPRALAPDSGAIRQLMRRRHMRAAYLDPELFVDPAWDMMLELYASALDGIDVGVKRVSIASGVPASTALRWIGTMTRRGLIHVEPHPFDARCKLVTLSAHGRARMDAYFAATADGHGRLRLQDI